MTNESGYHPIEDRIIVKTIRMEEKTESGLVIPKTTTDAEDMAQIHGYYVEGGAIAQERFAKCSIEAGDLIVFAKYSGDPFTGLDGEKYRIMNAKDVIGKSDGFFQKSTFRARQPMDHTIAPRG